MLSIRPVKTICCPRCKGTGRLSDPKQLGRKLRLIRRRLGLTVAEMAKHLAVTTEYVYMIETGVRRAPVEIVWGYHSAPGRQIQTKKKMTYAKTD